MARSSRTTRHRLPRSYRLTEPSWKLDADTTATPRREPEMRGVDASSPEGKRAAQAFRAAAFKAWARATGRDDEAAAQAYTAWRGRNSDGARREVRGRS